MNYKKISINNLDNAISYCRENNIDYVLLNNKLSNKIKNSIQTNEFEDTNETNMDFGELHPAFKIDKLKFFNSSLILWDDNYFHIYKNNKIINKINILTD